MANENKKKQMSRNLKKNKKQFTYMTHAIVSIVLIVLGNNIFNAYVTSASQSDDILGNVLNGLNGVFSVSIPTVKSFLFGLFVAGAYLVFLIYIDASKMNTRPGEEHGASRKGDIYTEAYPLNALENPDEKKRNEDANIILSKNIQMDIDTYHTRLNNNIFVVGGSGSGKTRFFVKPNILQMYCNYIVIDPKGSVAIETGKAFEQEGYDVKYLNFVDMDKSMGYNPFVYFKKPTDVQMFVKNLIDNTSDSSKNGGDEFFVKAEVTWLTSIIFLIMATCKGTDLMNMNTVLLLLDNSEAKEEEGADTYKSEVDLLFEQLEAEHNQATGGRSQYSYRDLAIKNYKIFKLAAGKTAKSILVSIGVRLSVFNLPELQRILEKDEVHLERIGEPLVCSTDEKLKKDTRFDLDKFTYEKIKGKGMYEKLPSERLRKSILFIVISDDNSTFSFLASIVLQQLYSLLYYTADAREDNKLPIHTRFINDEFANCGKQPDFNRKISTMRSREISTAVIVQGISQIKSRSLYGDDWEAIFENCDTTLFLGSKGPTTQKVISELGGKETVTHVTHSESKGTSYSYSTGEQILGRPVYDIGDIAMLDNKLCLVHIRGHHIYEDEKYDVLDHKRVSLTKDAKDKEKAKQNIFDVATFAIKAQEIEAGRIQHGQIQIEKEMTEEDRRKEGLLKGEILEQGNLLEKAEEVFFDEKVCEDIEIEIEHNDTLNFQFLPQEDVIYFDGSNA